MKMSTSMGSSAFGGMHHSTNQQRHFVSRPPRPPRRTQGSPLRLVASGVKTPWPARALRASQQQDKNLALGLGLAAQLCTVIPSSSPFNSSCTLVCTFFQPRVPNSRQRCVLFLILFLAFRPPFSCYASLLARPSWSELELAWMISICHWSQEPASSVLRLEERRIGFKNRRQLLGHRHQWRSQFLVRLVVPFLGGWCMSWVFTSPPFSHAVTLLRHNPRQWASAPSPSVPASVPLDACP